jgi:hypothetical protein
MRRKLSWFASLSSSILGTLLVAAMSVQAAPISYNGGSYTQDFNGLPTTGSTTIVGIGPHDIQGQLGSTGVAGWTMSNYFGSSPDTEYRAQDGSLSGSSGRGVVSFGTTASTDRALGVLATSNQISRFGVAFINNTGATLNQIALSFTGEQWRRGDVAAPGNAITYDFAVTNNVAANINTAALFTNVGSFSSPNSQATINVGIAGNLPANQVAVASVINNANWTPGSTLLIRWNGQDITGQDNGLAIDNLSLSASGAVPEPASFVFAVIAAVGVAVLRKRQ